MVSIESRRQVPDFRCVEANGGSLAGGTLPIFLSVGFWPSWFPFCQSCEKLATYGPGCEIWYLKFKFACFVIDSIILITVIDRLETEGRLYIVIDRLETEGR